MKELSIEEKAQRFDEAIERAKQWRNAPNVDKIPTFANRVIEEIFPELKESDDGQIRKEMISYFKQINYDNVHTWNGINLNKFVAWLEKQGEKKELKEIEQRIGDNIPQDFQKYVEHLLSLSDGEGHGSPAKVKEVSAELFKLVKLEQKPAWSEEDENIRQWIISDIDKLLALKKKSFIIADKEINWLKSLRPKNTWKPSDEQVMALRWVLNHIPYDSHKEEISGLLEQLKKLREE